MDMKRPIAELFLIIKNADIAKGWGILSRNVAKGNTMKKEGRKTRRTFKERTRPCGKIRTNSAPIKPRQSRNYEEN